MKKYKEWDFKCMKCGNSIDRWSDCGTGLSWNLYICDKCGHEHCVGSNIPKEAYINKEDTTVIKRDLPLLHLDVKNNWSKRCMITKLIDAIDTNDLREVERLIKNGVNVNTQGKNGDTPLHEAVLLTLYSSIDGLELVKLLIEHGANVNALGRNGETPLDRALRVDYNCAVNPVIYPDEHKKLIILLVKNNAN